jgi:hypothetical protein
VRRRRLNKIATAERMVHIRRKERLIKEKLALAVRADRHTSSKQPPEVQSLSAELADVATHYPELFILAATVRKDVMRLERRQEM